jgi:hypothetical protein
MDKYWVKDVSCEGKWTEFMQKWKNNLSVCLSVYLSIHPSICLSSYLSVYPSIHLSIHPSICLSIHPSLCLSIHPSVCLSIHPSVHLSICLSIYLSIYLSIFLPVCLSIYLSINQSIIQSKVVQCYTGYWFSVTFCYICQFTTSEVVRLFCFITLSTSISQ